MTDKKLTDVTDNNVGKINDNEIIKALECCIKSSHFGDCFWNDCPFISEKGCKVGKETLYPYALDLINRLQATNGVYETCNARKDEAIKHLESEVKKLQAENERLKQNLEEAHIDIREHLAENERLKKEVYRKALL